MNQSTPEVIAPNPNMPFASYSEKLGVDVLIYGASPEHALSNAKKAEYFLDKLLLHREDLKPVRAR